MEQVKVIEKEVTFSQQFDICFNYTVKVFGYLFIGLLIYTGCFGLPKILKTVQLAEIESKLEDVAGGLAEVQDYQVSQAMAGRKQYARK